MADSKEKAAAKEPGEAVQPAAAEEAVIGATEEWVFTIVSATGEIATVEKLDASSGQRQELSQEEYEALSGYIDPSAALTAESYDPASYAYDESGSDPSAQAFYEAGYYQAHHDLEAASYQAQHEYEVACYQAQQEYEAAYYQGMQDYEAAVAQQYAAAAASTGYPYSAEEHAAYVQGMTDYEALLAG